eukprot:CAMPEP_0195307634 /NCGR_PEP_ID=MMETSP0707-20130614/37816_1 /TAXON_ID=33640 /ORGANISM="Asterionellopsis glacialis, Strain CCMP134" /LENGTH=312 /DNA_ID=CAMNT_0040371887 /DNA_START=35 /DNA_END=970 /DNA_ORIENTATION=+
MKNRNNVIIFMVLTTIHSVRAVREQVWPTPQMTPLPVFPILHDTKYNNNVKKKKRNKKKKKGPNENVNIHSKFKFQISPSIIMKSVPLSLFRRQQKAVGEQSAVEEQTRMKTQLNTLTQCFTHVHDGENGDIDVKELLQACRSFAEATRNSGQRGVARDMESNIRKVEALYDVAPPDRRKSLSSLLQFERDEMDIHGPGGLLQDPSAAVGFLWIRRSLAFQSEMYKGVLRDPTKEPKKIALDAYASQLDPFHNWALRKLYVTSFSSMTPPRKEMLSRMGGFDTKEFGPEEENATLQDLQELVKVWQPILEEW